MDNLPRLLVAMVFALLFTITIFFLAFEVPSFLHAVLLDLFPDLGLSWQEPAVSTTSVLRPFGYLFFFTTLMLIGLSYILKSQRLSWLGAITLYIPVFGHFALEMFYFAGIGILRIFWLPLFDFSFEVFHLGDIILLPQDVFESLLHPFFLNFMDSYKIPIFSRRLVVLMGLLLIFLSSWNWFYGKLLGIHLIRFGIYRYSRHPQYLGLLILSYGILLIIPRVHAEGGYVPLPTLQWLIFALLIIRIALLEEMDLLKAYPDEYTQIRSNTPFLFPVPSVISRVLLSIPRFSLKKEYPDNQREITLIIMFYGFLLIFFSVLT
ncbi:MAG: methyltransferase family protein [Candidatus Hodarchaeales archaeon]|jgi:protein-S-isoprenylcysteine O-methyltransferase Ste14